MTDEEFLAEVQACEKEGEALNAELNRVLASITEGRRAAVRLMARNDQLIARLEDLKKHG